MMHEVPQRFWKENDFSSNKVHILQHLKLENGEKAIVRYTLKISSSNSWKLLKFFFESSFPSKTGFGLINQKRGRNVIP